MINSNQRKLALSGWLKENGNQEYMISLKLQKFLFFYESFAKIDGEEADFHSLKGYKRGPVFSSVWGDYTRDRLEFDFCASHTYGENSAIVNENRAKLCRFLVSIMSENELSSLTHAMDVWECKKQRIMSGEQQVQLCEDDFSDNDVKMMKLLREMYPTSVIDNTDIISIDNHYFLVDKENHRHITPEHMDTLCMLANNEELMNPVYVEIDEEGRLIID